MVSTNAFLALYAITCCLGVLSVYLAKKVKLASRPIDLVANLPVGTKYYYDDFTGRNCKRCLSGKIIVRKRFKTNSADNGEVVLRTLARVHWCNECGYRSVSIDKE